MLTISSSLPLKPVGSAEKTFRPVPRRDFTAIGWGKVEDISFTGPLSTLDFPAFLNFLAGSVCRKKDVRRWKSISMFLWRSRCWLLHCPEKLTEPRIKTAFDSLYWWRKRHERESCNLINKTHSQKKGRRSERRKFSFIPRAPPCCASSVDNDDFISRLSCESDKESHFPGLPAAAGP